MSDFEAEAAASLTGRRSSKSGGKANDVKTGLKVDVDAIKGAGAAIKDVTSAVTKLADEMERAAKASGNISPGSGANKSKNGQPQFTNTSQNTPGTAGVMGQGGGFMARIQGLGGRGGGAAAAAGASGAAGAATGAASLLGTAALFNMFSGGNGPMAGLGARMDRGEEYASGMDKLALVSQQIYGMSQSEAFAARTPMDDYRLGAGGHNALTRYQQTSGTSAAGMAPQVESLRALSGYSLTTNDVISAQRAMTDPQSVNRRMMLGMPTYTGNTVQGPQDLVNQAASNLHLDSTSVKGALRQGSATRANLTFAGYPEELHDTILTQAQAQITYEGKGGKGTYDAGNKDHQEIMGTDANLTAKQEETERIKAVREEKYVKQHIDNMETSEDLQRRMVSSLMSIEGFLDPAIGLATTGRGILGAAGSAMTVIGAGMMLAPGFGMAGGAAMIAGGSLMTAMDGDPPDSDSGSKAKAPTGVSSNSSAANDGNIKIPVGYGGGKKTLNEVKLRADFKTMHPKMQQRMLSMFRENPNLGIGGGSRNSADQEAMFRDRYRKTSNSDGDVFWEGAWWDRVKGAPAAPPGRSMHEIGLAADLVGDLGWLQSNAGRFGLKTFADVNNEPWHVQPTELPNSRREYEKNGSSWGSDGNFAEDAIFGDKSGEYSAGSGTDYSEEHGSGGNALLGAGNGSLQGLSTSEIIELVSAQGVSQLGGSGGYTGATNKKAGSTEGSSSVAFSGTVSSGAEAAAQAAFQAGFRGDDLTQIVAIAGRESSWTSDAVNKNTSDRGMWQINFDSLMKNSSSIAKRFNVTKASDLLDLTTNAGIAKAMFDAGGWLPWRGSDESPYANGGPGWDKNGDHTWRTEDHMAEAASASQAVMAQAGGGDPPEARSSAVRSRSAPVERIIQAGGGGTHVTHAPVITFSPTVHISGGSSGDLKNLADELTGMLQDNLQTLEMRNA